MAYEGRSLLPADRGASWSLFTVARAVGLPGPPGYVWVSVSLLTAALALIAWTAGATRADLGLDRADMRAGLPLRGRRLRGRLAGPDRGGGDPRDERLPARFARADQRRPAAVRARGVDPAADGDPGGVRLPRRPAGVGAEAVGSVAREPDHLGAVRPLAYRADPAHDVGQPRRRRRLSASVAGQVLVVLGSVAVTFVAGLVFCWLRLRSRSLIAPVMAHLATNGLALAVAWFTVHHGRWP